MFDAIVIGGGVIGGTLLRELTKCGYRACLLEKENDICMGQSKANSGIVHAGFDAKEGTLKARFNVAGNRMMEVYARELGVKFKRNGSLVVAFSKEDIAALHELLERGRKNGVEGLEIINASRLRELEPNISDDALAALYAPTGGIVCPYTLTIAAVGNAMDNGAELFTDFIINHAEKGADGFCITAEDGRKIEGKLVVNCAGLGAGEVASVFGDSSVKVKGRRGEYILLDRESGGFVSSTLFFTPTEKGKGILVSPTADGNIILGPTSEPVEDGQPLTSAEGLEEVTDKAQKMCKKVPLSGVITSFSGVRAYTDRGDFIVEESKTVKNLFHCAGIESPGLTSAPAIAEYVVKEYVAKKLGKRSNDSFNGTRKPYDFFKELSDGGKTALIKENPAYGRIVCRCEEISEGEIVRAIHENPPAQSVDAVKRRTRAGMGRCQGGFCQPSVAEILARELKIPFEEVTKSGEGSYLVTGVTK